MKQQYQSWLVPYVEGTLDERRRATLEARLACDPALAAEAEAVRRTAQRLRESAQSEKAEVLTAAAPLVSDLWPQIEARLRPSRRGAPRPWLWAGGGLCAAAASLGWATLWGPLTPHTAYPVKPTVSVQSIAEKTPPPGTLSLGAGGGRHPRKGPHGSGKPVKHPGRVKRTAPLPRPDPADLLANRTAPAATGTDSPNVADTTPSGSGHFRLATDVHDLPKRTPDPAGQDGATDKSGSGQASPDDGSAATNADEAPNSVPKSGTPSRSNRRTRHHRPHRRHRSTETTAPAQTAPALPPDTVPQAETAPKIPKHRPDID